MVGKTLNHYEVLESLGAGGMGEVYRARDTKLARDVAIKVLPAHLADDPDRLARFEREAKLLATLNHPNIAAVYGLDDSVGVHFIAMELVEGKTLRERLVEDPLSIDEALRVNLQISEALAAAHEKGIVHRDLKPENVILTDDDQVKVVDFGIAIVLEQGPEAADTDETQLETKLTSAGTLVGTAPYMSPEQIRGEPATRTADTWAFGCVLFESLSRTPAFAAATLADIIAKIIASQPDWRKLPRETPAGVRELIERCLAKREEDRLSDITVARGVIDEALDDASRGRGLGRRLFDSVPSWSLVAAAVLAAVLALWTILPPGDTADAGLQAIAVLPLENLSNDPAQQYFVDGMHEALIASLSKIDALRVISRTSVVSYLGSDESIADIATALGVDGVVEGSVLREGDIVRVTANLYGVDPERSLWTGTFERNTASVLELHDEAARALADELSLALTDEDRAQLEAASTFSPEAHDAYLRGRYSWNQQTAGRASQAVEYFNEALALEPRYALAYAGLADAYVLMSWASVEPPPPQQIFPRARAAAETALSIDDSLADAHVSMGIVEWRYRWDWEAAEREFRRAIALNPSSAMAHHWYGLYLSSRGSGEPAEAQLRTAAELDPLSRLIAVNRGWAAYFARDYQEAAAGASEVERFWPEFGAAHYVAGLVHEQTGAPAEAVTEFQRAIDLSGQLPYLMAALGHAQAISGNDREAIELMEQVQSYTYVPPSLVATILVGLGRRVEALATLAAAVESRDSYMPFLEVNPIWDPVRDDPRFVDLLRRIDQTP